MCNAYGSRVEILNSTINDCTVQNTSKYWVAQLEVRNIPYGIVKNMQDVFKDKKANTLLLKEDIEGVETVRVKTALI